METLSIAAEPVLRTPETLDTDCYELVLLDSTGTRVLLQQGNCEPTLPRVSIPRFMRPAREITSTLRTLWNMKTVLLWSGGMEGEQSGDYFAVLETVENPAQLIPGLEWFVIDQAASHLAALQAALLQKSQRKTLKVSVDSEAEQFSRLGWLSRLKEWVDGVVRQSGIQVRDFSQFNGSESFSLIRFETNSKPLWFKAVGAPNLHEFPITLLLSSVFPEFLPKILAFDPLLNGWLMQNGGEATLSDSLETEVCVVVVERLAELQIRSLGRASELLHAGCRDLRFEILKACVSPFFDAMADLMGRQRKPSPPPLSKSDLNVLRHRVDTTLATIAENCDLDTLGHADFNPGNVLVNCDGAVFIDWAEAYVGSPFLTFEYFLAHLQNSCLSVADHEERLREAYFGRWSAVMCVDNLRRGLDAARLIGPYAHAISANYWRDPRRLADVKTQGLLRSLGRRMKKMSDLMFDVRA